MIRAGAYVLPLLLTLPLAAQQQDDPGVAPGVLPQPTETPAVDLIKPVPPPSIPFDASGAALAPAMPKSVNIHNGGGQITYDAPNGIITYGGPVKVTTDSGIEIFADRATANLKTKIVALTGNVSVYQGNLLQRGESATFQWETKALEIGGLRASVDPILLESGKFSVRDVNGKMVFTGENAGVTTDDTEDPAFWLRAKRTTVYPDDKVVFHGLKLHVGDTPVFYLPYFEQPLNAELGYHFMPGARTNLGAYWMNTYGVMLGGDINPNTHEHENAWLLSKWHFDPMSRRGIGTGVDLIDKRQEHNPNILQGLSLYYLNDLDPSINRSGLPRGPVNEDRYKLQWQQRFPFEVGDGAKWRFDSNLTLLSDDHFLEDFHPNIYRNDPFPDNTLGIYRTGERSLASLYARVRMNDFQRNDTRLPEIAFDQSRAPLFDLPILHEGRSSFGFYDEHVGDPLFASTIQPLLSLPDGDPRIPGLMVQLSGFERQLVQRIRALPTGDPAIPALTAQLLDPSFTRFHTYHEFSAPTTLGGWLSITPQVGVGFSNYSAVGGPAASESRAFFTAGTEASVKFSKNYADIQNHGLGLNGLLHVVQPYTAWSFLATDPLDSGFPEIDRLTFSARPRTISVLRYDAVDSLTDWNIVRLGARNRLLTRRDGQTYEWLYTDTYVDAFLQDPEINGTISNLYQDVRWRPLPWMSVDVETQFPIVAEGSGFTEFTGRLRFQPWHNFEFSLGHRMLNNHPVLVDSNRIDLRTFTRFNEHWGFGTTHIWEADDRTLEVQQYTVQRDFGNWITGLGFTKRDNRVRDEFGVVFSLTLKDFPSASLPFRYDAE